MTIETVTGRLSPGALVLLAWITMWQSGAIAYENADEGAEVPLAAASPRSQGMDEERLKAASESIANGDYGDINSLLVVRNGYLVMEEYVSPEYYGAEYRYSVRSVTKSISSALIGIAIDQGKIPGVDAKLVELIPDYRDAFEPGGGKESITLEHVLSMSAGFRWDEMRVGYGDPESDYNRMARSDDWIRYVLEQPLDHTPGTVLEYNGGCSMLLSAILENATGMSAEEFANKHLFPAIGMEVGVWPIAPGGITNTAGGLALTRRDMARFGLLFLNQGNWSGNQVISNQWVDVSTAEHIQGAGFYEGFGYGYQWWRLRDHDPAVRDLAVNDVYFAYGDGSQVILVVPQLDLVVVSTGELHGDDWVLFFDLLRERILPAVLDR